MRRQLALLVAATTSVVLLAFLLPLAVLVSRVASSSAVSEATTRSQAVVSAVASGADDAELAAVIQPLERTGLEVTVGAPRSVTLRETTVSRTAAGAALLRQPVVTPDGEIVVETLVPRELLREGVRRAWFVLGLLGVLLVSLSLVVADRLARSITTPITRLAAAAERLAGGDLTARVDPSGPVEVREVGTAINQLAGRIGELLATERESAADLSHRLRTPITALRLDVDALPAGEDRDRLAAAVDEFTTMSEANGLTPCLFSVGKETADAAARRGWRTVQVAEDTIVDLPELQFTGKSWQDIRSALNKAKKDDITFRMTTLADEPFSVLAQVRAISEEWVGDKGLPEMGFTLGSVEEALDRDVRVGLAVDPTGSIHGVTSWLPVYGEGGVVQGWTLDVMRRRPDGFRPVVEFLIASSALEFKEQGAQFVSLSGAPLARSDDGADAASMDRLLDMLGAAMEPLYGFRSLHAFKKKFKPRYEPVFLCFRDEADLPRIGIALTRAYLPDATAPQLIKLATSKS